jgi:hypothetical protein
MTAIAPTAGAGSAMRDFDITLLPVPGDEYDGECGETCPDCGGECLIETADRWDYRVYCIDPECGYNTPWLDAKEDPNDPRI